MVFGQLLRLFLLSLQVHNGSLGEGNLAGKPN